MSNRNFDFSSIVKILNAQNNGNYYNRQQTIVQNQRSGIPYTASLSAGNPQTANFNADTIPVIRAGQQAYYFKNNPTTTVLAPQEYVAFNPPGPPFLVSAAPPSDIGNELAVVFTPGAPGSFPIYNYLYSVDNGQTFTAFSPAITSSPALITGLTNGVTYSIVFKSVSSGGDSGPSNTVSGVPEDNT